MKRALFFGFFLLLAACNKPEPNPEVRDPIYLDMENQIKAVQSQIDSEKGVLKEAEESMAKVVPQTGQINFARKHVFDSKGRLEKLQQLKHYFQLRLESRKDEDQGTYLKAFDKGETWPDPAEFETYKVSESARNKSRNWIVKDRIESERPKEKPAASEGEPKE